ncbi:hypothetical protein [Mycobacterium sp.]|uniref:hypothetical protein n=1 Tax=Mycobacterium sp. TaxID=1785 RepID=UPI0031DD6D50
MPSTSSILPSPGKHLVDLDEQALSAARAELATTSIKDTVNEALRCVTADRDAAVSTRLDVLAAAELDAREAARRSA